MAKLRRWIEVNTDLPPSSVRQGLSSRERSYFFITQVALTFAAGSLNWALIEWWVAASITGPVSGTYVWVVPGAYYATITVFAFPVLVGILATTSRPEKVIIAPTDINAVTLGVAAISLLPEIPSYASLYFLQMLLVLLYLMMATVLQNGIVLRIVGIRGSAEVLSVQQYSARTDVATLCRLIRSDVLWKALGLRSDWSSDDATVFRGGEGDFVFHICVSPHPQQPRGGSTDGRSLISIVGYEQGRLEIRRSLASATWFRAECSSFLSILSEARVPLTQEEVVLETIPHKSEKEALEAVPKPVLDKILAPTKNLAARFTASGEGTLRSAAILVVTLVATSYLYATSVLTLESAFGIAVVVIVTQVGNITWTRARKA